MYNGVGLQTARGSGTSGYVQKNLSHVIPGSQPFQQQDYGQFLKKMRENPLPPPKPPNQALLAHEQKRKIQTQVFTFKKGLPSGLSEEQIEKRVNEYRKQLESGSVQSKELDMRSQQELALAKAQHMSKLSKALKISTDHDHGAAFDKELQEQKRLLKLAQKEADKREEKRKQKEQKRAEEREKLERQVRQAEEQLAREKETGQKSKDEMFNFSAKESKRNRSDSEEGEIRSPHKKSNDLNGRGRDRDQPRNDRRRSRSRSNDRRYKESDRDRYRDRDHDRRRYDDQRRDRSPQARRRYQRSRSNSSSQSSGSQHSKRSRSIEKKYQKHGADSMTKRNDVRRDEQPRRERRKSLSYSSNSSRSRQGSSSSQEKKGGHRRQRMDRSESQDSKKSASSGLRSSSLD